MSPLGWVGLGVAILFVLGLVAYFAAPGPVNRKSLGHSVARTVGGESETPVGRDPECARDEGSDDTWSCPIYQPVSGPRSSYRVEVGSWGCWEAVQVGDEHSFPDEIEGCVKAGDHIRVVGRLTD